MKENFKKISLSLIAIIYLLATGISGNHTPDFNTNIVKSKAQVFFTKTDFKSSFHSATNETKLLETDAKKADVPFYSIISSLKAITWFIQDNYSQYLFNNGDSLLRFTSTDIIYPFHFFW